MDIAERLQELRQRTDYSQEQVADMLGISRQAVSKWESGQVKPEIDNIIKLTEIYDTSTDYILLGEKEPKKIEQVPPKELSRTWRRTIGIIAIIAATALITVLFITTLMFLGNYLANR